MCGQSAPASGRVLGIVRDGTGLAIADADILAVGQTIVSSRSDVRGRFQMMLPPGNYVLKATRTGYVSTYREPVRVDSSTRLERTITLTRQSDSPFAVPTDAHSHTDLAWQLRHLPRSVLRDESGTSGAGGQTTAPSQDTRSNRWAFLDQEFTGQVNLLTTASTNPLSAPHAAAAPRGVAFIVVGAPVGVTGDWRVRGAIGSGDGSSWNLLGEYDSRDFAGHAATFGVSYSAQQYQSPATGLVVTTALPDTRRVAGAFARDRWRVTAAPESVVRRPRRSLRLSAGAESVQRQRVRARAGSCRARISKAARPGIWWRPAPKSFCRRRPTAPGCRLSGHSLRSSAARRDASRRCAAPGDWICARVRARHVLADGPRPCLPPADRRPDGDPVRVAQVV